VGEMRVCRKCGIEKPLTAKFFPLPDGYFRWTCYGCVAVRRRSQYVHRDPVVAWNKQYQAIEARSAFTLVDRAIPPSDPHLDLKVVDVCWRDCVSEGQEAITRMVKRLAAICWNLPHSDRLSCAVVGYLDGTNSLAMVRSRLDELVA
jgi:hypothetical protein